MHIFGINTGKLWKPETNYLLHSFFQAAPNVCHPRASVVAQILRVGLNC